jgi:hypothetical protein
MLGLSRAAGPPMCSERHQRARIAHAQGLPSLTPFRGLCALSGPLRGAQRLNPQSLTHAP